MSRSAAKRVVPENISLGGRHEEDSSVYVIESLQRLFPRVMYLFHFEDVSPFWLNQSYLLVLAQFSEDKKN